jgi:hypothetical protein
VSETDYACLVDGCDRPIHDWTFCPSCSAQLEQDLAEIPAYVDELNTALTRQTAMGERSGSKSAEKPLPYDTRASEALSVLRSTLVGWVKVAVEEDGARWPADTHEGMARLLLGRLGWLRTHPAGNEAVEEIGAAVSLSRRIIDRPADRWFAGPCSECSEALYARPGAAQVTCKTCSLVYDVAELQEYLRKSLEGHLATAREISGLCKHMFGEWVTTAMIRGYVHRGSVAAHGSKTDTRGKTVPLYRMGDVFDAAEKAQRDPRAARKAAKDAGDVSDPDGKAA